MKYLDKLLTLKHWQLFLPLLGLPFLIHINFIYGYLTREPESEQYSELVKYTIAVILISIYIFSGLMLWFRMISVDLQVYLPNELRLNVKKFKAFFTIPIVYALFFLIFLLYLVVGQYEPNTNLLLILTAIHLFSTFCYLYIIYFASKTIKTIEENRKVKFKEFQTDFILMCLFPIGIWILQPRVNKIAKEKSPILEEEPIQGAVIVESTLLLEEENSLENDNSEKKE